MRALACAASSASEPDRGEGIVSLDPHVSIETGTDLTRAGVSLVGAVGGETELWSQPGSGVGGGIRARLSPTRGRLRGFFADLGVKSAGHWPGRPAGTGPFVRIGMAVPLP